MSDINDLLMTERTERGPGADPGAPSARRIGRIPTPSPWTPELVVELHRLHAEGFSTAEIAQRLSEWVSDGQVFTKNQVIGKLNREGLTKAKEAETVSPTYAAGNQFDLFPPSGTCVFAKGNGGLTGWQFCGAPLAPGSASYCREHQKVCFERKRRGRDRGIFARGGLLQVLDRDFDR